MLYGITRKMVSVNWSNTRAIINSGSKIDKLFKELGIISETSKKIIKIS